MINKTILTNPESIKMEATREGFGRALVELGRSNPRVVVLCADLTDSLMMKEFKKAFPERFVEIGVAEQNLAAVASGMAAMGMLPVIGSYAAFNPGRNWEQIRTTIAYNDQKVIIVGGHAGLSVGPDGGTHQALEDIALMRSMPNMTVLSPSDSNEAYHMLKIATEVPGPVYLRLAREKSPLLYVDNYAPTFKKAEVVYTKNPTAALKVGIIATGPIIHEAIMAAEGAQTNLLSITILNVHTIKPINEDQIVQFARGCNHIITLEEAQIAAGLGGLISEILSERHPTPITRLGVRDRYGQSGKVGELYKEYGVDREAIQAAIMNAINKY